MRIKRVECDQFAGLTGKDLEFGKGLNLVVGENESGKSTIIDLIFQLLFKDVKLDGRRDTDFIDQYFPKKVGGPQGDVIDGVLVFETPSGTYRLKKEWEKGEGTCRLTLPDGTSMKGAAAVREILQKELKHRAGVYSEIVFASRKRNQIAVESIMRALGKKPDALSDTRADLTSTLTRAALETGGVSLDKIEKAIREKMDALIGRWDWAADAPEGGPKRATCLNPWTKGAGEIVKAYYAADEVRGRQADAERAERAVEAEKADIQALLKKKRDAENERNAFQKFRGLLGQRSLLDSAIKNLEGSIKEQSGALKKWPGLSSDIAKARELQTKLKQAHIHELFLKAAPAHQSYLDRQTEFANMKEVDSVDLKHLRDVTNQKQREESRLAGMNLAAKIRKLGSAEIKVTSAASGEALELKDGEVQITEAVDIIVPGIIQMQLMPKGVDVETVKQNIASCTAEMKALYAKYGIGSLTELQEMSAAYSDVKQETERLRLKFEKTLGDNSWEEIKLLNDSVPAEIEPEAQIRRQIADLCGFKTVDQYIGGLEATLSEYENKYGSIDALKASVENLNQEKETKQEKLDSLDEIPEEYRGIDDPDRHDEELQAKIEDCRERIASRNERLQEAERNLGDKSAEEYSEELQDKEAALETKKAEYGHWNNIYRVFCRLKEQSAGNPVEDIEARFREYLEVISDGSLKLHSMDEQMSVQLASGANALTYDILSDGTKDTISLAFRLAMLEHLYPEGNGLAVFDDPFTDMDPKRVEQSCKLIEKYAENNQVIFVTCDDKYRNYLSGNVIPVAR